MRKTLFSRLPVATLPLLGGLVALNLLLWIITIHIFATDPIMLGTALLAWSLGLRHAVDADHIAAIDNVTRKLIQDGQRPSTVGFWFAVGHSSIVVLAAIAIALAASMMGMIDAFRNYGAPLATGISMGFLFTIGAMNLLIFASIFSTYRKVKKGQAVREEDFDVLLRGGGIVSLILRPLFRMIRSSWQMAPLGFLFGLGFDTATEVAILGVSAGRAADGMSLGLVMLFPMLFAAGMTLLDTLDGVLMLGAYEWALINPIRKLYYNMSITLTSAVVALLIGSMEAVTLLSEKFALKGGIWKLVASLNAHSGAVSFGVIVLFAVSWLVSWALLRRSRLRGQFGG